MLGKVEGDILGEDIEETVWKVWSEHEDGSTDQKLLGVFAGDFVAQHRAVVKRVLELYATPFYKTSTS